MRIARLTPALLTLAVVVPGVVVAPTFTAVPAGPHPVSAHLQRLPLSGVAEDQLTRTRATGRAAQRPPVVLTDELSTDGFRMLAVTWRGAPPSRDGEVLVSARTRTDGAWSDWFDVHTNVDIGTEPSPNGRFGTEPQWVGDSDGVQVRVDTAGAAKPRDLRVDLIEPGTSDADAAITGWQGSSASASTDRPPIVTRAEWGADESLRDRRLENNPTVKVAFVHHTAGSNSYTRREGPAVVRGLYSYYVRTLGYGDMGYNFLVDKYGTVYEGRAGSITEPVRSAATGGFNHDSLSIVAIGNFMTAPATDALVKGIANVAAYRLSRFHLDPFGHTTLTAEVGSSRYSAGEKARFKVISGHRDAGFTACPGNNLYRRLPDIRRLAKRQMGSSLIEPSISKTSTAVGQAPSFTVTSRVAQTQNWALTVRDRCTGTVVRRLTGTAAPRDPIRVGWFGRDDRGAAVPAGRYDLTLSSTGKGTTAWPFRKTVTIGLGGAAAPPSQSTLPAPAGTYVSQQPESLLATTTGRGITQPLVLGDGRRLDVQVLGRAGVPSTGVSAIALSVEVACASEPTKVFVGPSRVSGAGAPAVSVGRDATARAFVMARVGPNGAVRFQNANGSVELQASVVGYVSTDGAGGSLVPLRRTGLPGANPLSLSTSPTAVQVAGRAGVPADARAVVLVLRRGSASKVTSVWAWPESGSRPQPPAWRRPPGTPSASQLIVPLGGTGRLQLAADRPGSVSLQVAGYVAPSGTTTFHAGVPQTVAKVNVDRRSAKTVSVAGRAGVPSDAQAVVVSLGGAARSRDAGLAVWPRGASAPRSADVLLPSSGSRDSVVVVRLGARGDLRLGATRGRLTGRLTVLGWIR